MNLLGIGRPADKRVIRARFPDFLHGDYRRSDMSKFKKLPTKEIVTAFLSYDKETGILRWRKKPSQVVNVGDVAGNKQHGYVVVQLCGESYKAHRLIWLIECGDIGDMDIDHINMDRADNRLENLRIATRRQNQFNTKARRDNKSGFKGVSLSKPHMKWKAQINTGKNRLYLGLFDTPELAYKAYKEAADKFHGDFVNHG